MAIPNNPKNNLKSFEGQIPIALEIKENYITKEIIEVGAVCLDYNLNPVRTPLILKLSKVYVKDEHMLEYMKGELKKVSINQFKRVFEIWIKTQVIAYGGKALVITYDWPYKKERLKKILGSEFIDNNFVECGRDIKVILDFLKDQEDFFGYSDKRKDFTYKGMCRKLKLIPPFGERYAVHNALMAVELYKKLFNYVYAREIV